jgi:sarcosine oxidase gamma subunit
MKPPVNGATVARAKGKAKPSRKLLKEELREILIPRTEITVATSSSKMGFIAKAIPSGRDGWVISWRSPEAAVWKLAIKLVTPEEWKNDAVYAEASRITVEWIGPDRYMVTILK